MTLLAKKPRPAETLAAALLRSFSTENWDEQEGEFPRVDVAELCLAEDGPGHWVEVKLRSDRPECTVRYQVFPADPYRLIETQQCGTFAVAAFDLDEARRRFPGAKIACMQTDGKTEVLFDFD